MGALIEIIAPIFLVISFGYSAAWLKFISQEGVDGLMTFAQNFAVPCLLFAAISKIDLTGFNAPLLLSYYIGAFSVFALGIFGARKFVGRSPEDSVAIGFGALFPNTLLLGLAITERAYGSDALGPNYAIVAVHSPTVYAAGVISMEFARSRGAATSNTFAVFGQIGKSLSRNPLMIAIGLGLIVNFFNIRVPSVASDAIDMMVRAALPAALFGLGGIMVRYRPEGDMKAIFGVTILSLIVHPGIVYGLGKWVFLLDQGQFRSAVLTASMAPGVNAFLFASVYGAAQRVAASVILVATALSILTIPMWLAILP